MGWFQRLGDGLSKTRQAVRHALDRVLGHEPDPALIEELEAALLRADLGVHVVDRLLVQVREQVRLGHRRGAQELAAGGAPSGGAGWIIIDRSPW